MTTLSIHLSWFHRREGKATAKKAVLHAATLAQRLGALTWTSCCSSDTPRLTRLRCRSAVRRICAREQAVSQLPHVWLADMTCPLILVQPVRPLFCRTRWARVSGFSGRLLSFHIRSV